MLTLPHSLLERRSLVVPVVAFAVVASLAPGPEARAQSRFIHQKDLPLRITESGVWTVAEDLFTEGKRLTVAAPHVTLELAGYTIDGGIWFEAGDGLTVRNGTIICNYSYLIAGNAPKCATLENLFAAGSGVGIAIELGNGSVVRDLNISHGYFEAVLETGHDSLITGVRIENMGNNDVPEALAAGDRSIIRDCVALDAGGISVGSHGLIERCESRSISVRALIGGDDVRVVDSKGYVNPTSPVGGSRIGIWVGDRRRIERSQGSGYIGIKAGRSATVIDCYAWGARRGPGPGIQVGAEAVIRDCEVRDTRETCIEVSDDTRVVDNRLLDSPECAIKASGDRNTIEGNYVTGDSRVISVVGSQNAVTGNTIDGYPEIAVYVDGTGNRIHGNTLERIPSLGIAVQTSGNVIVGNTLRNNMRQAFDVSPGNVLGEVIDLTNGGTLPPGNCWANVIE